MNCINNVGGKIVYFILSISIEFMLLFVIVFLFYCITDGFNSLNS